MDKLTPRSLHEPLKLVTRSALLVALVGAMAPAVGSAQNRGSNRQLPVQPQVTPCPPDQGRYHNTCQVCPDGTGKNENGNCVTCHSGQSTVSGRCCTWIRGPIPQGMCAIAGTFGADDANQTNCILPCATRSTTSR